MSCNREPATQGVRRLLAILGFALACQPIITFATAGSARLTLDQALATALRHHPSLRATEAGVAMARADLNSARVYPYNPEFGASLGLRRAGGRSALDGGLSLSQTAELGGKGQRRLAVANLGLEAELAIKDAATLALAARVRQAFGDAVRAREEALLAIRREKLAAELLDLAAKRLAAGAGARLDLNLARAEAGRAARSFQNVTASYFAARAELAAAAGLDPTAPPEPEGLLPEVEPPVATAAELAVQAAARRPDLVAARRSVQVAQARVELAEVQAVPNLVLEGSVEREGDEAIIVAAGVSVPLPLFFRNQGETGRARAGVLRAQAEVDLLELDLRRAIAQAHARLAGAVAGRLRLETLVVGSLEESLRLLRRSLQAGEIGLSEVVLFQRQLLEGHEALIAARSDAWQARVELDLVTGAPLTLGAADQGEAR